MIRAGSPQHPTPNPGAGMEGVVSEKYATVTNDRARAIMRGLGIAYDAGCGRWAEYIKLLLVDRAERIERERGLVEALQGLLSGVVDCDLTDPYYDRVKAARTALSQQEQ